MMMEFEEEEDEEQERRARCGKLRCADGASAQPSLDFGHP